jgi:sodium--glutamate symport carrier gltS
MAGTNFPLELLALATVVLYIGVSLTQRIAFLEENFIPPAVTGGLLAAAGTWLLRDGFASRGRSRGQAGRLN